MDSQQESTTAKSRIIKDLMLEKKLESLVKHLDENVKEYQAFQDKLEKAKGKILAERDLRPDAYTRPITH